MWEYKVIDLKYLLDTQRTCDAFGIEGWELVGVSPNMDESGTKTHRLFFKRPLEVTKKKE